MLFVISDKKPRFGLSSTVSMRPRSSPSAIPAFSSTRIDAATPGRRRRSHQSAGSTVSYTIVCEAYFTLCVSQARWRDRETSYNHSSPAIEISRRAAPQVSSPLCRRAPRRYRPHSIIQESGRRASRESERAAEHPRRCRSGSGKSHRWRRWCTATGRVSTCNHREGRRLAAVSALSLYKFLVKPKDLS